MNAPFVTLFVVNFLLLSIVGVLTEEGFSSLERLVVNVFVFSMTTTIYIYYLRRKKKAQEFRRAVRAKRKLRQRQEATEFYRNFYAQSAKTENPGEVIVNPVTGQRVKVIGSGSTTEASNK